MWSEKYRFFHEILKDTVKEPEFTIKPIHIDQSYFDKNLYTSKGQHAWSGCSLKIDLLIESLENSNTQYILFTDADIVPAKNIYKNLKDYIDEGYTQVFLDEVNHLNIGFILLKVCPEVIQFWKDIKTIMSQQGGHDQKHVNDLISNYNDKWTKFDSQVFTCSNIWNGIKEFSIMQPLSSCLGKEYDFAEKIFVTAQHIEIEEYMKYVPEDIIPFIYKFQEIIFKSYKESAANS